MMKINTFAKGLLFLLGTSFAVNAAVSPETILLLFRQWCAWRRVSKYRYA